MATPTIVPAKRGAPGTPENVHENVFEYDSAAEIEACASRRADFVMDNLPRVDLGAHEMTRDGNEIHIVAERQGYLRVRMTIRFNRSEFWQGCSCPIGDAFASVSAKAEPLGSFGEWFEHVGQRKRAQRRRLPADASASARGDAHDESGSGPMWKSSTRYFENAASLQRFLIERLCGDDLVNLVRGVEWSEIV